MVRVRVRVRGFASVSGGFGQEWLVLGLGLGLGSAYMLGTQCTHVTWKPRIGRRVRRGKDDRKEEAAYRSWRKGEVGIGM